jgi:hypothetical protein
VTRPTARIITARIITALLVTGAMALGSLPAQARTATRRLPPPDRNTLARIFDPLLRDIGLRTTRARLQSLKTYDTDPHGTHLAVYVEPIRNTYTDAEYVKNIAKVAKVFVPMVFDRWKGLESFDVCQEPLPSVDPRPEPPPVTQLLLTRRGASDVSWKHITLSDLMKAANRHLKPPQSQRDFSLYIDARLDGQPQLVKARGAPVTTTTART